MKITNQYNLDPWLVELLINSIQKPDKDVFRVTSLIDSPLIRTLRIEHWDDIAIDVSDLLQTTYGDAVHDYLARNTTDPNTDSEQEVELEINGYKIRGHFDRMDDGVLKDYKTTGVGYLNIGENVEKWTKQLNIYAYLIGTYRIDVKRAEIHVLYRNWSKMKLFNKDCPPIPYEKLEVPLWTKEKQLTFIKERLEHHINNPYSCSDKERWLRPTTYAVKNGGTKKALRVLNTEQEAKDWMNEKGRGTHIETRPGEYIRCNNFCELKNTCPYYK